MISTAPKFSKNMWCFNGDILDICTAVVKLEKSMLSIVWYTVLGVSCFIILAGNCLFMANFFRVLGVNRGQISIFHFITPKRHILARCCVFWAIARQNPSWGLFSTLVREKKISHTKSYISPLSPEVPREPIFTKFGTYVPLVDLMNPGKLCGQRICNSLSRVNLCRRFLAG